MAPRLIKLPADLEKRYQELEEFRAKRPTVDDPAWTDHFRSYWEQMAELYLDAREHPRTGNGLLWSVLYDAWEFASKKAAELG